MIKNIIGLAVAAIMINGCTSMSMISSDVPQNSLRLMQIVAIGSRDDIFRGGFSEEFRKVGISESEIHDGSLVAGRIYCCGGTAEGPTRQYAYVPTGLDIHHLDIVEIRTGISPSQNERGVLNTVTRVIQKSGVQDGRCRWIPPDPGLWMRVLYCDWMKEEGWIEQTGWYHTWLKSPD